MEQPQIFASKAVWHVDIFDLNDFIAEKYELDKFEGHLEASNDSDHEIEVDGEVDEYDEEDLQKALKSGWIEMWRLGVILNDMCRKQWIFPGNYLVSVCW